MKKLTPLQFHCESGLPLTPRFTSMLSYLAGLYAQRLWHQFDSATHNPKDSQLRLLQRILATNRGTSFGQEHSFNRIRTVAEYRAALPIRQFSDFAPWIDRVAEGTQNVLTRERIDFFNLSSGTSGKPKLIPVTRTWEQETSRLRMLWGGLAHKSHPNLLDGRTISVVFSAREGQTDGGIPYGSLSGRVFLKSPYILRRRYALPYEVAEIKDPESKQYTAMRLAVAQSVSFLFSTNSATIISMVETADRRKTELIRDIHDGTLSGQLHIHDSVRQAITARISPDPESARRLEQIVHQTGSLKPRDYWQDSVLLGCWLGSTVGVAAQHLGDWFSPRLATRDVGLAASEGVFTLPIQDRHPSGILTVDTNFYEFIPVEEMDSGSPPTLGAEELVEGSEYVLVITTWAGLYRYNMNDVVRVTGHHHGTPLLEFVRKGKDSANLAGEKMHVSHILAAIAAMQGSTGNAIRHFKTQADTSALRYRLHVELAVDTVGQCDEHELQKAFDAALSAANPYYAKRIAEKQLRPAEICVMKPGWFERYVSGEIAKGARHGQFKPALLTQHAEPDHEKRGG